jgi:hypothetical protein
MGVEHEDRLRLAFQVFEQADDQCVLDHVAEATGVERVSVVHRFSTLVQAHRRGRCGTVDDVRRYHVFIGPSLAATIIEETSGARAIRHHRRIKV